MYRENQERKCPTCNEWISATAPKCFNCGEYVNDDGEEDDDEIGNSNARMGWIVGLVVAVVGGSFALYLLTR